MRIIQALHIFSCISFKEYNGGSVINDGDVTSCNSVINEEVFKEGYNPNFKESK